MAYTLWILCSLAVVGFATTYAADFQSALCARYPNNPNCGGGSASSGTGTVGSVSSSGGVPSAPNLPPPPTSGQSGDSSAAAAGDNCQTWSQQYNTYCVNNVQPEHQSSCQAYQQACISGGAGAGAGAGTATGAVNPSAAGVPPPWEQPGPSNVQTAGQSSQQGPAKQTWDRLTQQAQQEQIQRALIDAQNGQANCGQYRDHYNVWCGGIKPVNPTYCSMLSSACLTEAQRAAVGQASNGPFSASGGLPTGGAGSSRPLTIGENLGVGPFFGIGKQLGINPLQGIGSKQGVSVPIAGIDVTSSKGVDWGGLIGVNQLGQLLQGRKRRWATPVVYDQFGNKYILAN